MEQSLQGTGMTNYSQKPPAQMLISKSTGNISFRGRHEGPYSIASAEAVGSEEGREEKSNLMKAQEKLFQVNSSPWN